MEAEQGKQIVVPDATPRNVLAKINDEIEKASPAEKARLQARLRAVLLKKPA